MCNHYLDLAVKLHRRPWSFRFVSPRFVSYIALLIKNIPWHGLINANISYVSETKSIYTSKSSETYFPNSLSSTNSSKFSLWSVLQMLFNCSYVILNYVSEIQNKKDFWVGLLNSNGGSICSKIIASDLFQHFNYIL